MVWNLPYCNPVQFPLTPADAMVWLGHSHPHRFDRWQYKENWWWGGGGGGATTWENRGSATRPPFVVKDGNLLYTQKLQAPMLKLPQNLLCPPPPSFRMAKTFPYPPPPPAFFVCRNKTSRAPPSTAQYRPG